MILSILFAMEVSPRSHQSAMDPSFDSIFGVLTHISNHGITTAEVVLEDITDRLMKGQYSVSHKEKLASALLGCIQRETLFYNKKLVKAVCFLNPEVEKHVRPMLSKQALVDNKLSAALEIIQMLDHSKTFDQFFKILQSDPKMHVRHTLLSFDVLAPLNPERAEELIHTLVQIFLMNNLVFDVQTLPALLKCVAQYILENAKEFTAEIIDVALKDLESERDYPLAYLFEIIKVIHIYMPEKDTDVRTIVLKLIDVEKSRDTRNLTVEKLTEVLIYINQWPPDQKEKILDFMLKLFEDISEKKGSFKFLQQAVQLVPNRKAKILQLARATIKILRQGSYDHINLKTLADELIPSSPIMLVTIR